VAARHAQILDFARRTAAQQLDDIQEEEYLLLEDDVQE
jgi:hypothetical protein